MFVVAFKLDARHRLQPPQGGQSLGRRSRELASATIEHGWRVPAVKWLMVEAVFVGGVGIYAFYALQPYLLELYGDPKAYQVAGLVAAIVAGAQILGGLAAPRIRKLFHRRTSALIVTAVTGVATLALIGVVGNFYGVLGLIVVWALLSAASRPIRQTYLNGLITSSERASILSFDSMMASLGGVGIQPALGRAADVWGYAPPTLSGRRSPPFAIPFSVAASQTRTHRQTRWRSKESSRSRPSSQPGLVRDRAADAGSLQAAVAVRDLVQVLLVVVLGVVEGPGRRDLGRDGSNPRSRRASS